MAFMSGKLKVKGDMGLAMKLGSMFQLARDAPRPVGRTTDVERRQGERALAANAVLSKRTPAPPACARGRRRAAADTQVLTHGVSAA